MKVLTFDWPHRHRLHFLLPLAIALAAVGHAVIFVVFSASHPPAAFDGPRPATVYFLPPASAESGELASLLAADDPALFAPLRGLPLEELPPPVAYPATYASAKPQLAPLPGAPPVPRKPNQAPMPPPSPAVAERKPPPILRGGLQLRISPALARRHDGNMPAQPASASNAAPVRVFLGVLPDGSVGFATLDREASREEVGAAALGVARALGFSASEGIDWGFVDIEWGTGSEAP